MEVTDGGHGWRSRMKVMDKRSRVEFMDKRSWAEVMDGGQGCSIFSRLKFLLAITWTTSLSFFSSYSLPWNFKNNKEAHFGFQFIYFF